MQQTGIYEIEERHIGHGGNGNVYQITSVQGKYVQKRLKKYNILNCGRKKQLQRQVQILKKINHPNIVKYLGFLQTPSEYVIRMEFCQGQNLRDFLLSQTYRQDILKKCPAKFSSKVAMSIINALAVARKSMVLHRDLKLENVMIECLENGEYNVKLIDFGQSKLAIDIAQTKVGTVVSMAPQIYYGQPYTQQCDCFSLGILLFQIFEGISTKSPESSFLCPFGGFRPQNNAQVKRFYQQLIYEGINLTKSRTPKAYRKIIRGLLKADPKERLTLQEAVDILLTQFVEFENVEQGRVTKQKIIQLQTYQKQFKSKQKRIKQSLTQLKQEYQNKYIVLNNRLDKKLNVSQVRQGKQLLLIIKSIQVKLVIISQQLEVGVQYVLHTVTHHFLNSDHYQQLCNREHAISNYLKKIKYPL